MCVQTNNVTLKLPTNRETLPAFPVDPSFTLQGICWRQDGQGIPCVQPVYAAPQYDSKIVASYALMQWNLYLANKQNEMHAHTFLAQARWLVEHAMIIGAHEGEMDEEDAAGWPIVVPGRDNASKTISLSAVAQVLGIAVLLRAASLSNHDVFYTVAMRALATFERDILDGGVCAPLGKDGLWFEETAVYPSDYSLCGCLWALIGLADYLQVRQNAAIAERFQQGLATVSSLLLEFDTGSWTYTSLREKKWATPLQHTIHILLLEALNQTSHCDRWAFVACRWKTYTRNAGRYHLYQQLEGVKHAGQVLWQRAQRALFRRLSSPHPLRVCVAVPDFPATGGILTFLEKIATVTATSWQMEYLTQHIGSKVDGFMIHSFGTRRMTPWYFPLVWLYVLVGFCKLVCLMYRGSRYDIILAQDSIFTGALATLAARLTGVRAVCIDHGDLSLLQPRNSAIFQNERIKEVTTKNWPWWLRNVAHSLLVGYWPSRLLLARIAAQLSDHYLIPGIPEDGVNDLLRKKLGVRPGRITRCTNMIEIERHAIAGTEERSMIRQKIGFPADAILIAIVCRLAAEKGLEIAVEAISQALIDLPGELATNIRAVFVGDGPLREQVMVDIERHGLTATCLLLGELPMDKVITLLGISDIFLYTSWRGAGFPLAIMEAMASQCAVVASSEPIANKQLLGDGRGIVVPTGDIAATRRALVSLLIDAHARQTMGERARDYIARQHNSTLFRRALLRATGWSELSQLIQQQA